MKRTTLFIAFAICSVLVILLGALYVQDRGKVSSNGPQNPKTQPRVQEFLNNSRYFEANRGQVGAETKFVMRGGGYSLSLGSREAVLALAQPQHSAAPAEKRQHTAGMKLRMTLPEARPDPIITGLDELQGRVDYFLGNDPGQWRTNIPTYARVRYEQIYPGVDLTFYSNPSRELEFDFDVAPGGKPEDILLDFDGVQKLEIDRAGDLLLRSGESFVRQAKPIIFQTIDGVRKPVEGAYILKNTQQVGFRLGDYDRSRTLTIDPVLDFSTYFGGSLADVGQAITVDDTGNVYVAGTTRMAADFYPNSKPWPDAGTTAFVLQFDSNGTFLYSALLGGDRDEAATGVAVHKDSLGQSFIYLTGQTNSNDFPREAPYQASLNQKPYTTASTSTDAFVAKIKPYWGLVYSTYLGGGGDDGASSISVDDNDDAYVTGFTRSGDFGVTLYAFSGSCYDTCAFLTGLHFDGSLPPVGPGYGMGRINLVYSSYLGEAAHNRCGVTTGPYVVNHIFAKANAVAVRRENGSVRAYLTGYAYDAGAVMSARFAFWMSLNIPMSLNDYYHPLRFSWCGGWASVANGIAVDGSGNSYFTGSTQNKMFPVTTDAVQGYLNGPIDAFVTKLDPNGSLVFSTFLGGSKAEEGNGIALGGPDKSNVYVTGFTCSADFPRKIPFRSPASMNQNLNVINRGYGENCPSYNDAFITVLTASGKFYGQRVLYSTFLGGSGNDLGLAIASDSLGRAYVTGKTEARVDPNVGRIFDFPLWHAISGPAEAGFVTKISPPLAGDINGDCVVDGTDFNLVKAYEGVHANLGFFGGDPRDLNGDGWITTEDSTILNYTLNGQRCPAP